MQASKNEPSKFEVADEQQLQRNSSNDDDKNVCYVSV